MPDENKNPEEQNIQIYITENDGTVSDVFMEPVLIEPWAAKKAPMVNPAPMSRATIEYIANAMKEANQKQEEENRRMWDELKKETITFPVSVAGKPVLPTPAPAAKIATAPEVDKNYTKGKNVPKPNEIDCWTLAEQVAAISTRLLLYGPPGTGKSFGAARMGIRVGQEPIIITCTEDMSAIQLLGHFIPRGNEMVWMDGPIIKAWREGTRLVINEIDRASGDALTFFLGALDDPEMASMTLPNDRHEMVRPKRGFTVVATMNGEPDTDLPSPLRDRFASTIHINQVHPAAIEALPQDLRQAAKTSALVADEARRISVRKWNEFAFLRDAFIKKHGEELGVNMAAAAVFGLRANEAINALRINKVKA